MWSTSDWVHRTSTNPPTRPLFYKPNSIGLDIRIKKYVWHKSWNFNQLNLHTNLLMTIFGLKEIETRDLQHTKNNTTNAILNLCKLWVFGLKYGV